MAAAAAVTAWGAAARADAYKMSDADVTVVAPGPDRETAKPFKPTWCAKVEPMGAGNGGGLRRTFESWRTYGGLESFGNLAKYLCDSPDDPNVQKMAGYVIQAWMNDTAMSQKDATTSFLARIDIDHWKALAKETCEKWTTTDEDSAEIKETAEAYRGIYGCGGVPGWINRSYPKNLAWYLDRDADIPEVMRAYLVYQGLGDPTKVVPTAPAYGFNLHAYVSWGTDARRLDRARFDKQLAADPGNEYQQIVARETFSTAAAQAKAWQALIAKVGAKDPDLQKILVDVPEKAWTDWVALRAKEAAAFDDGIAFDALANAPSLSPVKGCDGKLRPHVGRALSRLAPVDVKAAETAIMGDPVGGPAMERYILCEAMQKNAPYAAMLYPLYNRSRGHRGPRMAVYLAALDAVSPILADRPKFILGAKDFAPPGYSPIPSRVTGLIGSGNLDSEQKGVVAATKQVGDGVAITFKKESYVDTDWSCTPTSKIYAIHADGRIEYDENCKVAGHHNVDTTPKPVVVPAAYAAGIAKGKLLVFRPDDALKGGDGNPIAMPVAVFDSKAMKKLEAVWGFAL
jgi:hypothetical protein